MKKDLLILSSKKHPDDMSVYDIVKTENEVKMYYSTLGRDWSYPGKLGYSLNSDEDGFIFIDHFTNKTYKLNCSTAEALRAALKLHDADSTFELLVRK